MDDTVMLTRSVPDLEEIQRDWHDLTLRVGQLEAEFAVLEQENKNLRALLERVIEHRQKSHAELVLLLSGLVSRLPINDVGVVVSRLVEHNAHVAEVCAALAKGKVEAALPQPAVLKALDQTKRDLVNALKPAVAELEKLDTSLEKEMLQNLINDPESFFSPAVVRANRCFVKGQVARERIVRDFGPEALAFFNDLTTDPKLNPRPKPEEIVLAFKNDFETLIQQNNSLSPEKRQELTALFHRVQRGKGSGEEVRAQKNAFLKLSFILELLHYYQNQNTEAPDVIFAQRLPALVEQLALPGHQETLDEKLIVQTEELLAYIVNPDHRMMVINNVGKGGGLAKTLHFVLRLRAEKSAEPEPSILTEILPEFIKHLLAVTRSKSQVQEFSGVMRLLSVEMQRLMVLAIMATDRIRREEAEALGLAIVKALDLKGVEPPKKAPDALPVEMERRIAWDRIKELIVRRAEPAEVATAIRNRLHAKYDADEVRQSWLILIETDPISLIRTFCQLPYLSDGRTDPIARAVMETYVTRLTHEKYAAVYNKVITSLKNMFRANPTSPTLVNFLSLVKWVDAEAATKMSNDIGMPVPTH